MKSSAGAARLNRRRWIFVGIVAAVIAFYVVGPGGLVQEIARGELAPDIVAATVDGGQFHLHDQGDALVLLDFWASWCGPCRESVPMVNTISRELTEGYPPLRVFGVNVGEDRATAAAAARELGIGYTVVLDPDMEAGRNYRADSIPMFVLLDTDRTILWQQVGHQNLIENIRRKVQERRAR